MEKLIKSSTGGSLIFIVLFFNALWLVHCDDYTIELAAANPSTYLHSAGGGAWNDGDSQYVASNLDGTSYACGDIISLLVRIKAPSDCQTSDIHFTIRTNTDTDGEEGVGLFPVVGERINYGQVPGGQTCPCSTGDWNIHIGSDSGISDNGDSTATILSQNFDKQEHKYFCIISVSNVDPSEAVIVHLGIPIQCTAGTHSTGNLHAKIIVASVPFTGSPTITLSNVEDLHTCNDSIGCTTDEFVNGVCRHQPVDSRCADEIGCTVESCELDIGCVRQPDHTPCNDNIQCTIDTCDSTLGCTSTPDDSLCEDHIPCTVKECDTVHGCTFTVDHSLCNDHDVCTDDLCDPKIGCFNNVSVAKCDDRIDCTIDSCDPTNGCVHEPDHAKCDDGSACTENKCDVQTGCVYTKRTCPCSDWSDYSSCVPTCTGWYKIRTRDCACATECGMSREDKVECTPKSCTRDEEYWKSHPSKSEEILESVDIDPESVYLKCGKSKWDYNQIWSLGKETNWADFARSGLAAKLNVWSGVHVSDTLDAALQDSDKFFEEENWCDADIPKETAFYLEKFNAGVVGPGNCFKQPCCNSVMYGECKNGEQLKTVIALCDKSKFAEDWVDSCVDCGTRVTACEY